MAGKVVVATIGHPGTSIDSFSKIVLVCMYLYISRIEQHRSDNLVTEEEDGRE